MDGMKVISVEDWDHGRPLTDDVPPSEFPAVWIAYDADEGSDVADVVNKNVYLAFRDIVNQAKVGVCVSDDALPQFDIHFGDWSEHFYIVFSLGELIDDFCWQVSSDSDDEHTRLKKVNALNLAALFESEAKRLRALVAESSG